MQQLQLLSSLTTSLIPLHIYDQQLKKIVLTALLWLSQTVVSSHKVASEGFGRSITMPLTRGPKPGGNVDVLSTFIHLRSTLEPRRIQVSILGNYYTLLFNSAFRWGSPLVFMISVDCARKSMCFNVEHDFPAFVVPFAT